MARVLIADDRPRDREALATLLRHSGHEVLEAGDGAEALETTRARHPDLIISDILMPTMDGYEFVCHLRAHPAIAHTPVIFYTAAYHDNEALALAKACGVSHVLTKPSKPEAVIQTVNDTLGIRQTPAVPALEEGPWGQDLGLLTDAIRKTVAERTDLSARLASLVEIGMELASEQHLSRLLPKFCRAARNVLAARQVAIGILDLPGRALRHFFADGLHPEIAARLEVPAQDEGVLGVLVAERRPRRLRDLDGDPRAVGLPPQHPPVRSFLGVPLATGQRTYGWLAFANKVGAQEFSQEDERLAITLAAQMAVAYENACLYEEVERRATELEYMNQDLDEFASIASHDLKEPLRGIHNYAHFLLDDHGAELQAESRAKIETIIRLSRRMGEIIDSLLHWSKVGKQAPAIDEVDLNQVLADVIDSLRVTQEEKAVEVRIPRPLPAARCDRVGVAEVLRNLISNAMKYNDKPEKWVEVGYRETGPEGDLAGAGGGAAGRGPAVFFVRDNGIGISPKNQGAVFRLFKRLHGRDKFGGGTGIGLCVVKKIIERHGGRIWIESTPGEGSSFCFTFEGGRPAPPASEPPDPPAAASVEGGDGAG